MKLYGHFIPDLVYADVKTFNEKLAFAFSTTQMVTSKEAILELDGSFNGWDGRSLFQIGIITASLIYKEGGKLKRIGFDLLDGAIKPTRPSGARCYGMMVKLAHPHELTTADDFDEDGKCVRPFSAHNMLWHKDNLKREWYPNVFEYDMNSSFSWGCLKPMPDTTQPLGPGLILNNQIGFNEEGEMMREGWAMFRFPEMESPFKAFIDHFWSIKSESADPKTKQKSKDYMNLAIGFLQRKNPYLRAAILGWVARYMWFVKDENTLALNTDAIFSTKERPDLPIGKGLGQFKLVKHGDIAFNGYNYQWKGEIPVYRGVPKGWFTPDFDITRDDPPASKNKYEVWQEGGCPKVVLKK